MGDKRTVSREALVNGIALIIRRYPSLVLGLTSPYQSDRESAIGDIGVAVDRLFQPARPIESEVESDGWIKCSERLPEKEGTYSTTRIYQNTSQRVTKDTFFDDSEWACIDGIVIAWRERHRPYAGEP